MFERRSRTGETPAAKGVPSPNPATGARLHSFPSLGPNGFHRIAYTEWGDPNSPHIVVCLHGFTRNSRDFDILAASLAERCRVVSMDAAGRGASEWLARKQDYDFSLYLADAAALLAHLLTPPTDAGDTAPGAPPPETRFVDWVGTSMGGLIGMLLAAKANAPIRRLVLNDVGPLVPWSALLRLWRMHYPLGAWFADLAAVEAHLREIFASFGPLEDAQWKHVAQHSALALEDGGYMLAFDPAIMTTLNHARGGIEFGHKFLSGVDLWPAWDRLQCPTLVLRGGASDVLLPTVAEDMQRRGPGATVVEFPGIGHAPWLMTDDQIAVVRAFLLAPEAR